MSMAYVGLDVHKKTISYRVKSAAGAVLAEGELAARRSVLTDWARGLLRPWMGAMEATLFTGWVYDHLLPHALKLKVAHPLMLRAIAASKKKNDRVDAGKIADLPRCDLLPACYMAPSELREMRRMPRYRNRVVRMAVRMKNRISGLLMEVGEEHAKARLHGKTYFARLLEELRETPESVKSLLRISRANLDMFQAMQRQLPRRLLSNEALAERVRRLTTIPSVGVVTALTWALEVGEPERFSSIARAVSYRGLSSARHGSAGKDQRGPISKQRNKHLQTVLIEAAKLAPRWNEQLCALHAREMARGNRNRATLAVARKLVAYLLAVDKSGKDFVPPTPAPADSAQLPQS